ncbi:SWIM zinc finger family protein [Priestia abyssalis]|uniref:SWIM zinc finger family protein n=1 Tax=Priestia abyssalis TaxID=1221450 RepID=UPI000994A0B2|nr:SWIM zinc finger family protein [Priestia abyssalis]
MDRIHHFLAILPSIDETYFAAMSNKGTYKRAVKDLMAAPNVQINLDESVARMQLADGTVVTFTGDIRRYSCTCGARTVCKHVIMALLAAKETLEGETQTIKPDFSLLLNLDVSSIVSEKVWGEILFRQQFQLNPIFEEGAVLIVSFPEENTTVRFLAAKSPADAICTCKANAICRHKAEAVYVYQKEKGMLHEIEEKPPLIIAPKKLASFKEVIERMVHLGLSRMTESTVHELEQLSVQAKSLRLAKLENLFRKLATDIALYRKKHASFQSASYRQTLSALYEQLLLLERHRLQERAYRSDYYEVPPLKLHGFGASGWQTKSGYVGVTYYFYHQEQEKWITYSQSRPLFYEGSQTTPEMLHENQAPWGAIGDGFELSRSILRLKDAKLNVDFQLSSSSHTIGQIEGKTNVGNWPSLFLNSWMDLLEKIKQHETVASKQAIFCIEAAETGEWFLHEQQQKWILPLIDKSGKTLHLQLMKRPGNEHMVSRVKMYMNSPGVKRLLVHPYQEGGKLVVTPIVLYTETGEILNITLNEGGSIYDRNSARY